MTHLIGFDTTVFPKLDLADPDGYFRVLYELKRLFKEHIDDLKPVIQAANEYKRAFDKLEPLIQSYTSKVCPYCGTVCCCNKHGFPEYADLVGMLAMGLEVPSYRFDVNKNELCQFIGEKGCVLPRARRPYRCTWYFCDPLLLQIEIGPPRFYRHFISEIQALSLARGNMLRTFYPIWLKLKGDNG